MTTDPELTLDRQRALQCINSRSQILPIMVLSVDGR
jgi:hypothetical protein